MKVIPSWSDASITVHARDTIHFLTSPEPILIWFLTHKNSVTQYMLCEYQLCTTSLFQLALCIDRLLKHVKCGIATYLLCRESLLMPRGMISFTAGHRHTVVWVMNYSGLWRSERPVKQCVNVCIWRELLYLTTALGVTPDRCCWWLILALVMKCSCQLLTNLSKQSVKLLLQQFGWHI